MMNSVRTEFDRINPGYFNLTHLRQGLSKSHDILSFRTLDRLVE